MIASPIRARSPMARASGGGGSASPAVSASRATNASRKSPSWSSSATAGASPSSAPSSSAGIIRALEKRPVSQLTIENLVNEIEDEAAHAGQGLQRDPELRARRDGAAQAVRPGQGGLRPLRLRLPEIRDDGRVPTRDRARSRTRAEGGRAMAETQQVFPEWKTFLGTERRRAGALRRQALGRGRALRPRQDRGGVEKAFKAVKGVADRGAGRAHQRSTPSRRLRAPHGRPAPQLDPRHRGDPGPRRDRPHRGKGGPGRQGLHPLPRQARGHARRRAASCSTSTRRWTATSPRPTGGSRRTPTSTTPSAASSSTTPARSPPTTGSRTSIPRRSPRPTATPTSTSTTCPCSPATAPAGRCAQLIAEGLGGMPDKITSQARHAPLHPRPADGQLPRRPAERVGRAPRPSPPSTPTSRPSSRRTRWARTRSGSASRASSSASTRRAAGAARLPSPTSPSTGPARPTSRDKDGRRRRQGDAASPTATARPRWT